MQAVAGAASTTFFAELYFLVMNLQITSDKNNKDDRSGEFETTMIHLNDIH